MMDRKHCNGCRDDYYNSAVPGGCWQRKDAKVVTRFRIHRDTMPASPGAFTKVRVPNCKYGNGWYYQEKLPDFVKLKDVVRSPAARTKDPTQ